MRGIFLLLVCALPLACRAQTTNLYTAVVEHNSFDRSVVVPATNTVLAKITVSGTVDLFGYPQVLAQVNGTNYILKEGEGQDDVVVLKIRSGQPVTFLNHGVRQEISLQSVSSGNSLPTIKTVPTMPEIDADHRIPMEELKARESLRLVALTTEDPELKQVLLRAAEELPDDKIGSLLASVTDVTASAQP